MTGKPKTSIIFGPVQSWTETTVPLISMSMRPREPQFDSLTLEDERRIYLEGIRHFNAGEFFEAHEVWEEAWTKVLDKRREQFYRAIIRGAVALELLSRGRAVGARQVFLDCKATFEGLPAVFNGLDIPAFIESLRKALEPALSDLNATAVTIRPDLLFPIILNDDWTLG